MSQEYPSKGLRLVLEWMIVLPVLALMYLAQFVIDLPDRLLRRRIDG